MNHSIRFFFPLLLLLTLILQGCQTAPTSLPSAQPASLEKATAAENAGEFVLAANEYQRLAESNASPKKELFQLKSVEALIKAAQIQKAKILIRDVNVSRLHKSFLARKQVLWARIALLEGDANNALRELKPVERIRGLDPSLTADIYWVKSQANIQLGNHYQAAGYLIHRQKLLVAEEKIEQNQRQIWLALTALDANTLVRLQGQERVPEVAAWLALAEIGVQHAEDRHAIVLGIKQWKTRFPAQPVTAKFLEDISRAQPGLIGRVNSIALLLPLNSRYKAAAEALRDGFMAMDRTNPRTDKPAVRIYDFGEDPAKAADSYKQAVKDGADFIVGPLGVEATQAVVNRTNLKKPTLLLSHTNERIGASNIFQFALSPEQEAQQAAERAYLDGHRLAAVLYPNTPWGERIKKAFTDHWESLGGLTVRSRDYDTALGDHADSLKDLLNITQGEERKRELSILIKQPLKYEARIRQDIDFIFLAADRKMARLIKPQLNFHQARQLPVYSTSHVYAGKPDRRMDQDLNGIIFGDMPWLLIRSPHMLQIKEGLQESWPYAGTALDRLYAMGVDSYAIIPQLNRLSGDAAVRFNGVTSSLSLTATGQLHRQLVWAKFRGAQPRLLDTGIEYRDQLEISLGQGSTGSSSGR